MLHKKSDYGPTRCINIIFIFLFILFLLFTLYISPANAVDGPHGSKEIRSPKGVCATCHIPHKAKGDKIWARTLLNKFGGVRQLCNSCHDGTFSSGIDPDDPNSPDVYSGIMTVFGSAYESHVMHGAANIEKDDWLGAYDKETFPVDPKDKDNVPNHPSDWDEGGVGFYCGSCHNPHVQLKSNGDYLRTKKNEDIGDPNNRSTFCKQCHNPVETKNSHLEADNCQACHDPHMGYQKAREGMSGQELKIARLILKAEVDTSTAFIAQPNVPEISDSLNDPNIISSSFCYGCHQARHILDQSDPNHAFWIESGAAPIYGDKIKGQPSDAPKNHHPMGIQAKLNGDKFLRAQGIEATLYLNKNNELTCISCHAGLHGVIEGKNYEESKKNNFLRWDFTNDNAEFCLKCHNDKGTENGQIVFDEKHFWDTNSPVSRKVFDINAPGYEKSVSCRQCMFCHFIHDGEERNSEGTPENIRADINALMRIGPVPLTWGDRKTDNDETDYEDMCYGCHGNQDYVGEQGPGALLEPGLYYTHPFASEPSFKIDPNTFLVSDGEGQSVLNDYGTEYGKIFCGTCHNVHQGSNQPYLRSSLSPYEPYGFCEACHDADNDFVNKSHPIAKGPNNKLREGSPTADPFPSEFTQWTTSTPSSGRPGGTVTDAGEIMCLTCHNTHAAKTSSDGRIEGNLRDNHGKLLVMDNYPLETDLGDNLCRACHNSVNFDPEDGASGPHGEAKTELGKKGICHNCHRPHKANGEKIWARSLDKFDGVRQLCNSCHDETFKNGIDPNISDSSSMSSGLITVFGSQYESHVMHGAADIKEDYWLGTYFDDIFLLDPNDTDHVPNHPPEWDEDEEGDGFYCGSCHNPHIQPEDNGDYLRTKENEGIGDPNSRAPFCKQCHNPVKTGNPHLDSDNCEACHHPHMGYKKARFDMPKGSRELKTARLILRAEVDTSTFFIAQPNVPEISDDPNDATIISSSFCYGCHQPRFLLGSSDPNHTFWIKNGAAPIYGDRIKGQENGLQRKNHHPMGTETILEDSRFLRAPGEEATKHLNKEGEITCISCHDDLHGGSKANNFLRWDFTGDNALFCIKCHSDKSMKDNQIFFDNKHFWDTNSPQARSVYSKNASHYETSVSCRQCMFCHYIHDGEDYNDEGSAGTIKPYIDTLMRVEPKNLAWGDRSFDTDLNDYEDMCYGCHGDTAIVNNSAFGISALLDPNYFTHRFACQPESDSSTSINIKPGKPQDIIFPLSDGTGIDTPDDYGTEAGHIYCGTCHNVHAQYDPNSPYLNSGKSPYTPKGFCEACHDEDNGNGEFVKATHPIGKNPNDDPKEGKPTYKEFVDFYDGKKKLFNTGGSGRPGGVTAPYTNGSSKTTGQVICLTCHNTHAAETSWDGRNKTDARENHGYLLVKDNMKKQDDFSPGSELCKACHPFGESEYSFPSGAHGEGDLYGAQWGICNACHTPHDATAPKLWWRSAYHNGPFKGFRQLCFTCHRVGNPAVEAGIRTVFKGVTLGGQIPSEYPEDHVTRGWADVDNISIKIPNYSANPFTLDPTDQDVIPNPQSLDPGQDPNSHDGFYCGSCHNPHIQQGASYLRSRDGYAGLSGKRREFCNECHIDAHFDEPDRDCLDCHHPHQGVTMIDNDPNGRWILLYEYSQKRFLAEPNVDGFTGADVSSTCYGCHGPSLEDPNRLDWSDIGATTIYGDINLDQDTNATSQNSAKSGLTWIPKEHHPMGKQARFGQCPRAPGADRSVFNKHGELTCTSCHSESHKGERENNYLRWDFKQDNSHFCQRCHPNKQEVKLGPPGGGHHQTRETSPVKRVVRERNSIDRESPSKAVTVGCGNCMFCHFIHDGEEQGVNLTPSLNALMRFQPVNLRWADAWQDEDSHDYEDLCYGCHSQGKIVGGVGGFGSLIISPRDLGPEDAIDPIMGRRYSHRFRCEPNSESPTMIRLKSGGPFPISDGTGEIVVNDYGTEAGRIYCGTCHDVHNWGANPGNRYLRGLTSPYVPGGFCHECHSAETVPNVCSPNINHRLLAPPPIGISSIPKWSPALYSNLDFGAHRGKGEKGGFVAVPTGLTPEVGQMTCLTCHNLHAAETTYDGFTDRPRSDDTALVDGRHGKLLIIDNGHGPAGSDLCIICHPEHSQIIGSFHDFSYRGLDGLGMGIAPKGVCSACHRPHLAAPGSELLWARPIVEEKILFGAAPGFALGSTLYCYDCHSGIACDVDPLPDLFLPFPPQDVAFIDGPGGFVAGYYESLPAFVQDIPPHRIPSGMPTEIKTAGHYVRQPIITPGIKQNDKLACYDCHNPHRGITKEGITNQAFMKPVLGGKPMGPYKASINMTYHKEIRNNLESRQACVACHGLAERPNAPIYLPATFADVNPKYTSILLLGRPPSTVYDHFDAGLYACTDCHRHNRAMVLCIDCHGYPPATLGDGWRGPADTDQNYTGGAGSHYTHVVEHQFPCTMCHRGCLHDPGGATVVNPSFKRAKVSIDFDKSYAFPRVSGEFQTKMGYYSQDGKSIIPPLYDPIKQTCYVGCHNPLVGDPDQIPNLDNSSPSWSLEAPHAPTPPSYPSGSSVPSWINMRTSYPVPGALPGIWQIPWGP